MNKLKEKISELKNFSNTAFSIGLKTKAPISNDTAMNGFGAASEKLPGLIESDFDAEKKELVLRNAESEPNNQVFFKLDNFNNFSFAWGENSDIDIVKYSSLIFDVIKEDFSILPINIEYIDISMYLFLDYNGDHYELISNTFYNNSLLNNLFEKNRTFGNDVFFRGQLNEMVIAIVRVDSDQSSDEILNNKFRNEILKTRCSIGQIKGFSFNSDLYELYKKHSELAFNYFKDIYIPNVIIPLDKSIIK